MNNFAIVELYCGQSGKIGFYNNQELGICKAMKKHGFNCFVFYPDTAIKDYIEEVYDGITVVRCPAKSIGVHGHYDWNVLKKYDIDYAQIDGDNQMYVGEVSDYCDANSIRYYYYLGTISSDSHNPIKKIVSSFITSKNISYYRKHKCFVKTKQLYDELKDNDINDVEIVNVGLDLSVIPDINEDKNELRKQLNLPLDKKILLFVGRMEDYKRPMEMFEIIDELDDNYYSVMIGDGSLSSDIDSLISTKYNGRVTHIKRIDNKDIHRYFKASDYFLNLNDKEIFGMSMLEAMNQGCDVVAIRSPGASEIIDDNSGFIVNDLKEMIDIIKNDEHKNSNQMKNRILDCFSWDRNIIKFVEYLKG